MRSFREEWDEDPDEFEYDDRVALDREVLRIRERLEDRYEDREVDFYREPVRETWRAEPDTGKEEDTADRAVRRGSHTVVRRAFGDARVWALSAGVGGRMWGTSRVTASSPSEWDLPGGS